jgi:hypothetical protein
MNPAVTIFMLLRPCFIFDIRRFVVASCDPGNLTWILIWEF